MFKATDETSFNELVCVYFFLNGDLKESARLIPYSLKPLKGGTYIFLSAGIVVRKVNSAGGQGGNIMQPQ